MDYLASLDVSFYRALNAYCGWSPALDRLVVHGQAFKGAFFLGIVGWLWYWPDKEMLRRRETLLIIILSVAISLAVNRAISTVVPFRFRPMYSIGANHPSFEWHADQENWSSFPSDNATYLFAIAAGFWLIWRRWGLFFGFFATLVALGRVFLGIHYPSDIFIGAVIGIATSLAVNRQIVRNVLAAPLLTFEPRYPPYFYGLFFLVLAELSGGFPITRHAGVAIVHLFTPYKDNRVHSPLPVQVNPQLERIFGFE